MISMNNLLKGFAVLGLMAMVVAPMMAGAQVPGAPSEPAPIAANQSTIYHIINNVISIAFYVLMLLAILFILWAAFNYLTAAGNPEKVETAQKMLLYAVIAIVIGVLARSIPFIIATFVTSNVTQ